MTPENDAGAPLRAGPELRGRGSIRGTLSTAASRGGTGFSKRDAVSPRDDLNSSRSRAEVNIRAVKHGLPVALGGQEIAIEEVEG